MKPQCKKMLSIVHKLIFQEVVKISHKLQIQMQLIKCWEILKWSFSLFCFILLPSLTPSWINVLYKERKKTIHVKVRIVSKTQGNVYQLYITIIPFYCDCNIYMEQMKMLFGLQKLFHILHFSFTLNINMDCNIHRSKAKYLSTV